MTAVTHQRPAYRVTFRGVVTAEWTKFWSLRSSAITTVVAVLVLIAVGVIAAASATADGGGPGPGPGGPGGPRGDEIDALSLTLAGNTFAALAVGALGVLLAAGEYTTGMIRSTMTAVPRRLPVLGAKALVAGVVTLVATAIGALAAFQLGTPLLDDSITRLTLGDDGVLRSVLGAGLYLGLVAVLGVGVGALVRSSAGGVAILAGALLVLPGLVSLLPGSWTDDLTKYLPSNAGATIMSAGQADGAFGPWAGLAVFTGYVALVLAAAAVRLRKTDV
ncbi:ABC transporter permease [Actinoplanes sp. RD1]|uniref:ABC transporter permease n=1 Tax=Actinoplanes sp. RD1 TaxID=3064538 RepID=UPI0027409DAB|nr:ABC transporter permease [Actinoplanes sp. RD1]